MSALDFPSSPAVGQLFQQSESQPAYLWDGTVWKLLAQPKGVEQSGFRNLLINGDMGIWRRNYPAANFTGSTYLADRWQWSSTGTYLNPLVVQMSPGAVVGCEAARCMQLTVNSVAGIGNYGYLLQKVEFANSLVSNEPYTLSFWANTGGQSLKIGMDIQRAYGSGGSPSPGEVIYRGQLVTAVSLWKRFFVTFTAPSMGGKTVGTNGDDMIYVILWLDAGSTYNTNASSIGQQSGTWQFTNMQLERGVVATPFERRPPHIERLLCQRYYNSGQFNMMFASPSTGGFASTFGIEFPATMRASPTMVRNWNNYGNVSSFVAAGTYPWAHYEQVVASGMVNAYGTLSWEAAAEL